MDNTLLMLPFSKDVLVAVVEVTNVSFQLLQVMQT